MTDLFMGETPIYWMELHKQARKLDVVDYIREIADLRGKVSFYESRIVKLNEFMIKNPDNLK